MRFTIEGLFVKISGVTSEEDALLSIGLGADAVAFDFAPSPRRVSADDVHDIVRRLPPGVTSIGVFRSEMPQRIVDVANRLGLSAVQIDGPASDADVAYVAERVNTVLRSVGADAAGHVAPGVDYLVLPDVDERDALVASLELFRRGATNVPVIASGGLDELSVVDVVRDYPVFGVDARSCVESSPGVKDPVRLGGFIARARRAYEDARVVRLDDDWL